MSATSPLLRVYSVGQSHCFLLRLPDGNDVRHLLVDYGSIDGRQMQTATRRAIHANILELSGGRLDVVIVSSERRDALRGLLRGKALFDRCRVANVWMGRASHPDHTREGESARLHGTLRSFAGDFGRRRRAGKQWMAPAMERLAESVGGDDEGLEYARTQIGDTTCYLTRGAELKEIALGTVDVSLLAPEPDVGVYYQPAQADARQLEAALRAVKDPDGKKRSPPLKPAFLSDAEWRTVRERRAPPGVRLLRAFQSATDDCSLVFQVVVNGKRLLFLGDSGRESWNQMSRQNRLKPVDFLAAGEWATQSSARLELLDKILPKSRRTRTEVVVRHPGRATLEDLKSRARVRELKSDAANPWFDIEI